MPEDPEPPDSDPSTAADGDGDTDAESDGSEDGVPAGTEDGVPAGTEDGVPAGTEDGVPAGTEETGSDGWLGGTEPSVHDRIPDDGSEDGGGESETERAGDGDGSEDDGGVDWAEHVGPATDAPGTGDGPVDADGDAADEPLAGEPPIEFEYPDDPPATETETGAHDGVPVDADAPRADADGGVTPAGSAGAGTSAGAGAATATAGAGAATGTGDELLDSGIEGPAEDEEMPLADHIEEMMSRLGIVFLVGGVALLLAFPAADQTINYLWNTHIPGAATIADRRPRLYGPLELVLTELKVAGLAGLIVGLPVFVYQSYRFMRPGLYPTERRYYLAAVPTSLVLAFVGVAFAHFVVLPAIFLYFTSYTTGTALVAFGLKETFNLILLLMGYMAIVFQIPLFIMLGIMMGLVTRVWLQEKRLLFWGAFAGLAFLVSPDPTGMAPIIIAATMITLFEGTLALLRWTGN
jgi:sec-independent protein translocase protein TatC